MTSDYPMISCLCPTRNRRAFLRQSLAYFQAQDYPNRELIIVDDSAMPSDEFTGISPAIRYLWLSQSLTTGAKRNVAASLARGDYLCLWDDDDYFGPTRLSAQAAPLLSGEADASAMRMSLLLDVRAWALWTCSDETHRHCFKQDIHYGTLLFPASYWHNGTQFANATIGEDVRFVHALLAQDARIARVVSPAAFVYVLHGGNTTSDMRLVHPDGWASVPMEQYLSEDMQAFYRGLAEGAAYGH